MDTIEFKGMDSPIQAVPTAAVSPASSSNHDHEDCQEHENGHICYGRCEDAKTCTMPDTYLSNTGRVLDVSMTLKNVCPCRRVAVGILVSEVDHAGNEASRGFKAIAVPAHYNNCCSDIQMQSVRFILPDSLNTDGNGSLCERRHFIVRTEAHYIDTSVTMPG